MTASAESRPALRRQQGLKFLLAIWATLALLVFAWQAFSYWGLIRGAGEWQFHGIGSYYPALTVALLVILFGAPLFYIFAKSANKVVNAPDNPRAPAERFLRIVTIIALTALLAAVLIAAFPWLRDLGATSKPVAVQVGTASAAAPETGPATVSGTYLLESVAIEHVSVFGANRNIRYIPVIGNDGDKKRIRYFVEAPLGGAEPTNTTVTGTLRLNALPGPIVRLFEDSGLAVDRPHYVLFTNSMADRVPYFVAALQLGIFALLSGCIALFQRWRLRRISSGRRKGTPHAVG